MSKRPLAALISLTFLFSGCASLDKTNTSRLDLIQKRGELKCGISGKIPGFSFLNAKGSYQGLDVDICRAMAAALVGNGNKVQYRPLTAPERFTALKTGEVDLLSRNTTFNLTRDASGGNGVTFAPVVFHDGQGLMTRKDNGITSIKDLANSNICVGSGTTTEQNLNDIFQENDLPYTPIKYQDLNQVISGYLKGRCKAMTSDMSQLAASRSSFPSPTKHIILDKIISKEPLAPVSVDGDHKLSDAMRWVVYALIAAEEFGINQENINTKVKLAKTNPSMMSLRRFLGVDGGLGKKLGLDSDFVVKVISTTGNYGEIYERHLGPSSAVPIPRNLNRSYKKGGLLISPPFK